DAADLPASGHLAHQIVPAAQNRQVPSARPCEVVGGVIVRGTSLRPVVLRPSLVVASARPFIRQLIYALTIAVTNLNLEPSRELVRQSGVQSIEVRIGVGLREIDRAEGGVVRVKETLV